MVFIGAFVALLSLGSSLAENFQSDFACRIATEDEKRVTFVYSKDIDEELLRCLFRAQLPLFVVNAKGGPRTYRSLHLLTYTGRYQELDTMLRRSSARTHLSRYVLLFKGSCTEFLEAVFRLFWKHGFINVVALCGGVYTYEPYSEEGFRIVRLSATTAPKLFYDKLKNLHGHQIRVSQFYDPIRSLPTANSTEFRGIDGLLGHTIIQHLNATSLIVVPPNDELYGTVKNGTITGALKHVTTGYTEVNWNIRYIDAIHRTLVEAIYPIGKPFFLHLVVPKSSTVPQYLNFIRVFDTLTWWMLFANFFLIAALFAALQQMALRLPHANRNLKLRFRSILGMFFKTAIGDPVEGFHRISSLRQFLISWILFCYVISSIYFAKMESVFIHPEYEKDIDTLSELSRLKIPIYTHANFLNIIKPSVAPQVFDVILANHRLLPQNYEAQIRAMTRSTSSKYAYILRRERASAFVARTYDNEANQPVYHIVKEYLASLPQTYIVTKGSPFFYKFERLVIWCFEHGLLRHWEAVSKAQGAVGFNNGEDDDVDEDDDELEDDEQGKKKAIVLTMDILQGAFYLWIIGTGAGCVVFVAEVWWWRRTNSAKSKAGRC